jgi:hypothetical protein
MATGAARAEEKEPTAVIGLGLAGEWAFSGPTTVGPTVSVEFGVVKDWLEIEIGTSTLFRRGSTEWETDLIFKKPFTLSPTVEFMVGAGPTWSYTTGEGGRWGTTFALDFMFWPQPDRKLGWFLEPTYTISQGNERSLSLSVGLLVPIE